MGNPTEHTRSPVIRWLDGRGWRWWSRLKRAHFRLAQFMEAKEVIRDALMRHNGWVIILWRQQDGIHALGLVPDYQKDIARRLTEAAQSAAAATRKVEIRTTAK